MNKSYSLHKILEKDNCPFREEEYSKFKFGDKFYAEKFAKELFEGFVNEFRDLILSEQEIVILPSPYLSIPTASNFLCYYFKKELNSFLFKNNKKASIESKIYRNQTYVTDYGNLDFSERVKLISNDTYYIDRNFIEGKLCIFVDDIKITGSHEHTVNKILDQYNVNGDFVFVYFAELANKEIHPKIENHYNYFSVKNVEDIVAIINSEHFQYNTRIVKFILSLNEDQFNYLVENISAKNSNDLFHLAISNNYHQILEYKTNINVIKID
ncbi:phosphoribosyltransferase family protein [Flavobacterium psychroterrae]|uniref:Phosphoribosyltransferase family protein n=1 Tax=Flavobacterium psychroterrae TaxID=2133767 RepID=A0ABS5PBJ7_9FLAO|nr:phosphoribosyltransferase family protein [Flavobacterium psychroterrae]MBS7231667.1 phosphoribosyltransferase family protein [Flavobacterium psychroterrae]